MNKSKVINRIYYQLKPFIPRRLQISLRRKGVLRKRRLSKNIWPIDERASNPPDDWLGWPEQKRFALVLTHDVDTQRGHNKCLHLMRLEQELGFRSSFNFVPERYEVSGELRHCLIRNGFEVGVHGLKHDGKLYKSEKSFRSRAVRINHYLKDWKAVGFRSPAMHHNLNWLHALDIDYDASTFDTDPFEPQSDGAGTIFPFWVEGNSTQRGYVELPYTLSQDFTLFVLCRETNVIWKQKLDWIVSKGGMVLMNTHPDCMNFEGDKLALEEYPVQYYQELLQYIKSRYKGTYWHALPRHMCQFWSTIMMNSGE